MGRSPCGDQPIFRIAYVGSALSRGGFLLPRPLRSSLGGGLISAGLGLFRLLLGAALLLRASLFVRLLSASGRRAIDELHKSHLGIVTRTGQHAENASVAARTSLEARAEVSEQLLNHFAIAQSRERQAAVRLVILLRERNERLDDPAKLLRLRNRRADRFVTQQRNAHVAH